jgi:hypothetical protein
MGSLEKENVGGLAMGVHVVLSPSKARQECGLRNQV